jgi:hypothetical protein
LFQERTEREKTNMVNRISNLIKEMNRKELITASGEQGKIKRLIRLQDGSTLLEFITPNGELSMESFYAFAFSLENERVFQECQEIDYCLNRIDNKNKIEIF